MNRLKKMLVARTDMWKKLNTLLGLIISFVAARIEKDANDDQKTQKC